MTSAASAWTSRWTTAWMASTSCACWTRQRSSAATRWPSAPIRGRSEEHTSELQSPCNLVCRLLLEKKKKKHDLLRAHLAPALLPHDAELPARLKVDRYLFSDTDSGRRLSVVQHMTVARVCRPRRIV